MIVKILLNVYEIDSISRSSNVVTVDTSENHGYSTGDYVQVSGVLDDTYNGYFQITVVDSDTFTYSNTGADGSSNDGQVYRYDDFPDNIVGNIKYTKALDNIGNAVFFVNDPDGEKIGTYWSYQNKAIRIFDDDEANILFNGYIVDVTILHNRIQFQCEEWLGIMNVGPCGFNSAIWQNKISSVVDGNGGAAQFVLQSTPANWTDDDQWHDKPSGVDPYGLVVDFSGSQSKTLYLDSVYSHGIADQVNNLVRFPYLYRGFVLGKTNELVNNGLLFRFRLDLPRKRDPVTKQIIKSTVTNATLRLRCLIPLTGAFTIKYRLIPMDNCPAFHEADDLTKFDLTNTTNEKSQAASGTTNQEITSPDLSDLINDWISRFDVGADEEDPYNPEYYIGIVMLPDADCTFPEFLSYYSIADAIFWKWSAATPHLELTFNYPKFSKAYGAITDDVVSTKTIYTQATETPNTDGIVSGNVVRLGYRLDKACEEIAAKYDPDNIRVDASNFKDANGNQVTIIDYSDRTGWSAIRTLALEIGEAGSYIWLDSDGHIHVDDDFDEYTANTIEESDVIDNNYQIDRGTRHLIGEVLVRGNVERGCFVKSQKSQKFGDNGQILPVLIYNNDKIVSGEEALRIADSLYERYSYIHPSVHLTVENYPDLDVGMKIKVKFKGIETVDVAADLENGAVRSSNVVTITTSEPHLFKSGESITISDMDDSSFNGTFTISSITGTKTFTYAQAAADATSGGGKATSYRLLVVRKLERTQDAAGRLHTTLDLGLGRSTELDTYGERFKEIRERLQEQTSTTTVIVTGNWTSGETSTISDLDDLTDVAISGVADKDILQYQSSSGDFENKSLSAANIAKDDEVVKLAGSQAITGTKTFDSVPVTMKNALGNTEDFGYMQAKFINDITASADELNVLDGITVSTADLNSVVNKMENLEDDTSPTLGGDLDLNQHDLLLDDNVNEVFQIRQGSNVYLCITTTNGSESIKMGCGGTEVADFNMSEVKLSKDLNLQGNSITADTNVTIDKPLKRANEGYIFVKRGDVNKDYDQTDLTIDGNWHDLDLSAIVGSSAKAALLRVTVNDNTLNNQIALKQKGYTYVQAEVRAFVTNVTIARHVTIGLDSDQKLSYNATSGTNYISITVLGWYE